MPLRPVTEHVTSPPRIGYSLDAKLPGVVGDRTASALKRAFGMITVADLLTHYPRRYARRGELTALAKLPLGEDVTIIAEVREVRERPMRQRRGSILEVSITDGEGFLTLTWFNQKWRADQLRPGTRGIFAGKVTEYRGKVQLAHPDYHLLDDLQLAGGGKDLKEWAESPIPIYPATSTVASWQIQKAVEVILDGIGEIPDPVPAEVRTKHGLLSLTEAFELIHRPEKDSEWRRARDALRFQEAFVLQTALLAQRAAAHSEPATPRVPKPGGLLERFDAALPFELTGDQKAVGADIERDMATDAAMMRLLQGEVGSGKTLVAVRAMLAVADSGGQSALLAPTEVLATQHLRSIAKVLGPDLSAQLMPTLLTGQMSTAERKKALLRIVTGQARIVVGTHALLSESVQFYDLGFVVVDEQHRFGVEQRDTLRRKGATPPHVLVMTATPIPRTVAMTVFGDLDVSVISELPAGRQGIQSVAVPIVEKPAWGTRIWERVHEELELGRQAFVVCPAIDASGSAEEDAAVDVEPDEAARPARATVLETVEQLRKLPVLASARIEVLHGRMPGDEKDAVMRAFAAGDIDILVATTVIEVGVDVPNASVMVILDADRFGVSQLHQLRGRVGRGGVPGLCLLVTAAEQGTTARERVEAVARTLDGFELAESDVELRREGDVLGSTQSGARSSLRLLRVVKDADVISDARAAAGPIIDADPTLAAHPALAAALERRLAESEREFLAKT
ncbi:ATP-dependent DNA helicase RecG [Cnuibacter sp. UC19_7]|uniref:ATP-dependent DNA helicase RecG n=1 Tax=Cnuibacter sp. UC19_7 TaxID=3350166 RepID=UPI003672B790